jgi:hypothetical protein
MATDEIVLDLYEKNGEPAGKWKIVAPELKLGLKYGIVDPEHSGWSDDNRSFAYDTYAQTRGREKGLPTVSDLGMTLLMNSMVDGNDLATLHYWIMEADTRAHLKKIRNIRSRTQGLHAMSENALKDLAGFADFALWSVFEEDEEDMSEEAQGKPVRRLYGIASAKLFKWLATWAPHHVPMLDSLVHEALTGHEKPWKKDGTLLALQRFKNLVEQHHERLSQLGAWIFDRSNGELIEPLSPVRVLDNLIWFDWRLYGRSSADGWIDMRYSNECYPPTKKGERWLRKHT